MRYVRGVALAIGLLLAGRHVSAQIPGPGKAPGKGLKGGKRGVLPPEGKAKQAKQAKQQAVLERFLQMSPDERRSALAQLPPARREQILRRLNALELLSDSERRMLRGRFDAFADLPPVRRQALRQELQQLRRLTPAERSDRLASAELRERFSEDELQLIEEVAGQE